MLSSFPFLFRSPTPNHISKNHISNIYSLSNSCLGSCPLEEHTLTPTWATNGEPEESLHGGLGRLSHSCNQAHGLMSFPRWEKHILSDIVMIISKARIYISEKTALFYHLTVPEFHDHEGIGFLETGYWLLWTTPHSCWKWSLGLPEEQPVLLTTVYSNYTIPEDLALAQKTLLFNI